MSVQYHPGIAHPYAAPVQTAPPLSWPTPPAGRPDEPTVEAARYGAYGAPAQPQYPMASSPYYPAATGWQPGPYPVPAPRNAGRTWAMVGAAVAVMAITGTGLAMVSSGSDHSSTTASATSIPPVAAVAPSPTTPAPAPLIPVSALPGMLATPAAVASAVGGAVMAPAADPHADQMFGGDINPAECAGVYHPAANAAYQGSGWTAVQDQILREPGQDSQHTVIQTVVAFPTAQAASAFAAQQKSSWSGCTGKSVSATYPKHGPETFSVAAVNNQGPVLTALISQEGGGGWACERALTSHNNVVIDVAACAALPNGQAVAIANGIGGGHDA